MGTCQGSQCSLSTPARMSLEMSVTLGRAADISHDRALPSPGDRGDGWVLSWGWGQGWGPGPGTGTPLPAVTLQGHEQEALGDGPWDGGGCRVTGRRVAVAAGWLHVQPGAPSSAPFPPPPQLMREASGFPARGKKNLKTHQPSSQGPCWGGGQGAQVCWALQGPPLLAPPPGETEARSQHIQRGMEAQGRRVTPLPGFRL